VAADYTRVIVFKVEDQAIKRATDRITRSLEGIEKTLGRIEQKGFGKIAKEADVAAKSIDKLSKSARGLKGFQSELGKNLMTTKGGGRVLSGGLLGAAMGGNWLKNQMGGLKDAANAILHPFSKATEVATVKTGALSAGLTKLSALASAQPVAAAAMAVAYMAFGDQINRVAKQGIVGLLGGLDKLGKKAYDATGLWRPLNYELKETVKLQEQVVRQQNLFKLPGGRIGPKNRAFGIRQQGTPIEEEVRMRNRAINQRAAEQREAKMIADGPYKSGWSPSLSRASQRRIKLDSEFKNLPSVKAARNLEAIEKKRLLIARRHLRANEKLVKIGLNREALGIVTPGRNANTVTGFSADQYGPQPAPLTRMQRWGIGKGANQRGWAASPGGVGGRWKGAAQSGMIGGGFPLLFGQSPAAAVAGGIGGTLGGALSPGFGFAGSIIATAAAQKIGEIVAFRKSIKELNADMQSMGFNAGFSAKEITRLGKSLGITKEEAVQVAEQFKRFGKSGGLFAKAFGGDFAKFSAVAQADDISTAMQAIKTLNKDMTLEEELRLTLALRRKGVESTINELIEDTLEKQKKAIISGHQIDSGTTRVRPAVKRRQAAEIKEIDEGNIKTIEELTKIRDLYSEIRIAAEENSYSVVKAVENINTELRKLNSPQYQVIELSKSIGSSFSESFKGIIQGTMTVQDAFRNMFSRIADHFLDMAARMAAAQLQKGILSLFNFGPSNSLDSVYNSDLSSNPMVTSYFGGGKAAGGPVKGGTSYVVGEKGPELFVPGSSGNIVPNHAMGGANIVVNVDASGSSVEGDAGQAEQLGLAISQAIQSELMQQKRPGGLLYR
jgi:hypothetical protein